MFLAEQVESNGFQSGALKEHTDAKGPFKTGLTVMLVKELKIGVRWKESLMKQFAFDSFP